MHSAELGHDFGVHSHVAPLARFSARVAQKRYTFYLEYFKYRQEELIPDTIEFSINPPLQRQFIVSARYFRWRAIWTSHFTKGSSPSPAEINLDSSAHPVAKTRHLSAHTHPQVSQRPRERLGRRAEPGSPAQGWRSGSGPPTIRTMNRPFRPAQTLAEVASYSSATHATSTSRRDRRRAISGCSDNTSRTRAPTSGDTRWRRSPAIAAAARPPSCSACRTISRRASPRSMCTRTNRSCRTPTLTTPT